MYATAGPLWTTFVPQLSTWQRNVLGFPKPGDSYWSTPHALDLVADRYPGIDLSDYVKAAKAGVEAKGGYGRLSKAKL